MSSSLTHLDISYSNTDDQAIGALLKCCPKLSSLDISYCTQLTNKGIQTIALNLWDKKLVSLKIAHCKNPLIQAEDWIQFIQLIDLTKIEVLDLSHVSCDFTSSEPLEKFANIRPAMLVSAKIKNRSIPHFCR